ncbi:MBOAT family O-acyltransferase [Xanthobacter tagetidis]|uniref:Probable alginate O-acetylase AlgI n=1 Tax=Xanthobacter tagetidis TaxID=60216 RepID=A0A3L7AMF6_9HYPH|nr:MBOAT family protein [Xanthobacter tagetidis]MBB6307998.1 D-alanyl-lipoteichoic acid acyltransferase DltB (MBOAT superfamily) [Xanthobacter tagetidis]RLP81639.1 MBOAT family protein [Xanthobacter tagetidis]
MVFSSVSFFYYFLPLFLLCYFIARGTRVRNFVLLAFSLVFYAWGGLANVIVLAVYIVMNYVMALVIDPRSERWRLRMLAVGVTLNLSGLIIFKYSGFLAENLNHILAPAGLALPVVYLPLPLGISFFSFHAISYLVDVYRRRASANSRFEELALYITMFPQLVAGPIVRYSTINRRIRDRRTTLGRVSAGLRIFVIGLSWKVLIADELAPLANAVFDSPNPPNLAEAWLGMQAYALQIYFDFGGYSNMAIGLALAMGLKFPRNFNLPYGSISIADLWRRWHMSLSSWFRDYLYIPLGGNRLGEARTLLNLWTVFFLCGLWHGAQWTFVVWGLHHGTFLVLERTRFGTWLAAAPRVVAHAYVLLVVCTSYVWFRSDSIPRALEMFQGLIGLNGLGSLSASVISTIQISTVVVMLIGWPLSMFGLPRPGGRKLPERLRLRIYGMVDSIVVALLFVLCAISVGAAAYSPFLYFRF